MFHEIIFEIDKILFYKKFYFWFKEHESADQVATAIRVALIDGETIGRHHRDREILSAVYDIDILPQKSG